MGAKTLIEQRGARAFKVAISDLFGPSQTNATRTLNIVEIASPR